jgi:hypothetical protein
VATFTPPYRTFVPRVLPSTPERQRLPSAYMKADIPRGVNVFIDLNDVVSESQPVWANIKTVFYGGHSYDSNKGEITGGQLDLLTAAGYGANIV